MIVTFDQTHSEKATRGQKVEVDKIKTWHSETGFGLRVINVWPKPRWFDLHWFKECQEESK